MKAISYLVVVVLMLISCRSDQISIEVGVASISTESVLFDRISRTVQNPTGLDDFLDNNSATRIEFPYTISLQNNQELSLNSAENYADAIEAIQLTGTDIQLQFPIEVSLVNFQLVNVENQSFLNQLSQTEPATSEINCVRFMYPLEINSFLPPTEVIQTRILSDDKQLYNYLSLLKSQEGIFDFTYPFQLLINQNQQQINSVAELESVYASLEISCFNPNLFNVLTEQTVIAYLVNNSLEIVSFIDDGEDETNEFEHLSFLFLEDNSILVENTETQQIFEGVWSTLTDDGHIKLVIDFNQDLLDEFNEDWRVISIDNNQLSLADDGDSLIFQKI